MGGIFVLEVSPAGPCVTPSVEGRRVLYERPCGDINDPMLSERDKTINLYGKDMVEKIERGEKGLNEGNGVKVDLENIWK